MDVSTYFDEDTQTYQNFENEVVKLLTEICGLITDDESEGSSE